MPGCSPSGSRYTRVKTGLFPEAYSTLGPLVPIMALPLSPLPLPPCTLHSSHSSLLVLPGQAGSCLRAFLAGCPNALFLQCPHDEPLNPSKPCANVTLPPRTALTLPFKNYAPGSLGGSSVKRPTLGFSTGHDLMVYGFEPHVELCTGSVEPAWDSVSPSLSPPPLLTLYLSLSKIMNR